MKDACDLFIIGGGINGAAIARDAAGRGLSVVLAEARDLAGATSSASSKLIHGGLRYLEYYEFRLVRHALAEREVLLRTAPHLVHPQIFILPHEQHLRPVWMIRAGLFLYDHLASHVSLPGSHGVNLRRHDYGAPLKENYRRGFSYADCVTDDARLTVLNALDACERGADILTRTVCTGLKAENGAWTVTLKTADGSTRTLRARAAVNAAGPWARRVLDDFGLARETTPDLRLVQGSHIVVRKLYDGPQAYVLQEPDRRIVFAIPYQDDFTLIGTTETDYHGDPAQAHLTGAERAYLIAAINRSFRKRIGEKDVVWHYSGVRPLLDDHQASASAVTREYKLALDKDFGPSILSVFGGKLTAGRLLAETAVDLIAPGTQPWTADAAFLGGDFADFNIFAKEQTRRYPFVPEKLVFRYARAYGTRMERIIENARSMTDLGKDYGSGLYEAEIHYLIAHEWARSAEDILWRRSKQGLHAPPETVCDLEQLLKRAKYSQQDAADPRKTESIATNTKASFDPARPPLRG